MAIKLPDQVVAIAEGGMNVPATSSTPTTGENGFATGGASESNLEGLGQLANEWQKNGFEGGFEGFLEATPGELVEHR